MKMGSNNDRRLSDGPPRSGTYFSASIRQILAGYKKRKYFMLLWSLVYLQRFVNGSGTLIVAFLQVLVASSPSVL
jgi:hypothetical protein